MAEPAVTFLLENVRKLLMEQIKLASGAENELRLLKDELEQMKEFLVVEESRREKGELFRQYERQVREAVYKAEDTIDACLTLAAASANKKSFSVRISNLTKRLDLAKEVKSIREEILKDVFFRARQDFSNLTMDRTTRPNPQPLKTPVMRDDNLVGFDDEAKTLIGYINEVSDTMDVISIVGMPGLGKTTLAWRIYRHQNTDYEFPILIWVYVSQDYDIREVFLTILKKLTQQDMSSLKDHELAAKVRDSLQNSKFLLFLDDIWSSKAWDDISAALPKNNGLGKVMITSLLTFVAIHNPTSED